MPLTGFMAGGMTTGFMAGGMTIFINFRLSYPCSSGPVSSAVSASVRDCCFDCDVILLCCDVILMSDGDIIYCFPPMNNSSGGGGRMCDVTEVIASSHTSFCFGYC